MCESLFKTFFCCIPFLLVLGLAAGLGYYFATKPNNSSGVNIKWPTLEDFHREQPWNASSPEEAQRWDNNGKGLTLELLNALDTQWYSFFEAAVADWDQGLDGLDPLTLTTSVIPQESECWPVSGKLKVCNGDYGDTGWNGINTIVTNGQSLLIDSSVAKMNEYYLSKGSNALKQYTMCHEIGHGKSCALAGPHVLATCAVDPLIHFPRIVSASFDDAGFGLPHTDESFWNRDLGNCMDYTLNPGGNLHPDYGNFEFLEALYGNTNGGGGNNGSGNNNNSSVAAQSTGSGNSTQSSSGNYTRSSSGNYTGSSSGNYTGSSGGSGSGSSSSGTAKTQGYYSGGSDADTTGASSSSSGQDYQGSGLPDWVTSAWDSISKEFSNYGSNTASENNGWRLLRSRGNLRSHRLELGGGYAITVNVLLADGYGDRNL